MSKNTLKIALVSASILLIPLIGNTFVDGWNWSGGDFIMAFVLFFITGLIIDFIKRKFTNTSTKTFLILVVILGLFLFWVELAVDAVSKTISYFF